MLVKKMHVTSLFSLSVLLLVIVGLCTAAYGQNNSVTIEDMENAYQSSAPGMTTKKSIIPTLYSQGPIVPFSALKLGQDVLNSLNLSDGMTSTGAPLTDSFLSRQLKSLEQNMLAKVSDPERNIPGALSNELAKNTLLGNTAGTIAQSQANAAINYNAKYLVNFTVDAGNKWNKLRNELFMPIALLLLLVGAVAAQVRAIIASGSPILGDVSPFEGIMRATIAAFLIPATYLVVNYGIDFSNAISAAVNNAYKSQVGGDMYADAVAAQMRAFPPQGGGTGGGAGGLDLAGGLKSLAGGAGGDTSFSGFEKALIKSQTGGAMPIDASIPSSSVAARAAMFGSNVIATALWTLLCAFQMAYFYYLFLVGPIMAALWVWPVKQLREAFPSWVEGVLTLSFWSLFWQTTILIMACCRDVDGTGTVIMSALNFLSTACVKYAFDFAGLVSAAGQQAMQIAQQPSGAGNVNHGHKDGKNGLKHPDLAHAGADKLGQHLDPHGNLKLGEPGTLNPLNGSNPLAALGSNSGLPFADGNNSPFNNGFLSSLIPSGFDGGNIGNSINSALSSITSPLTSMPPLAQIPNLSSFISSSSPTQSSYLPPSSSSYASSGSDTPAEQRGNAAQPADAKAASEQAKKVDSNDTKETKETKADRNKFDGDSPETKSDKNQSAAAPFDEALKNHITGAYSDSKESSAPPSESKQFHGLGLESSLPEQNRSSSLPPLESQNNNSNSHVGLGLPASAGVDSTNSGLGTSVSNNGAGHQNNFDPNSSAANLTGTNLSNANYLATNGDGLKNLGGANANLPGQPQNIGSDGVNVLTQQPGTQLSGVDPQSVNAQQNVSMPPMLSDMTAITQTNGLTGSSNGATNSAEPLAGAALGLPSSGASVTTRDLDSLAQTNRSATGSESPSLAGLSEISRITGNSVEPGVISTTSTSSTQGSSILTESTSTPQVSTSVLSSSPGTVSDTSIMANTGASVSNIFGENGVQSTTTSTTFGTTETSNSSTSVRSSTNSNLVLGEAGTSKQTTEGVTLNSTNGSTVTNSSDYSIASDRYPTQNSSGNYTAGSYQEAPTNSGAPSGNYIANSYQESAPTSSGAPSGNYTASNYQESAPTNSGALSGNYTASSYQESAPTNSGAPSGNSIAYGNSQETVAYSQDSASFKESGAIPADLGTRYSSVENSSSQHSFAEHSQASHQSAYPQSPHYPEAQATSGGGSMHSNSNSGLPSGSGHQASGSLASLFSAAVSNAAPKAPPSSASEQPNAPHTSHVPEPPRSLLDRLSRSGGGKGTPSDKKRREAHAELLAALEPMPISSKS
ncbi:hypothetical protein BH10CYA1_BH10CYA1_64570 [soil metagenome]